MTTLPRLADDDDDDSLTPEVLTFLRQALSKPAHARELLSVTVPVQPEAPEKFLRLVPRDYGFLWRSPSGEHFAGGGAAAMVMVEGPDRFARLATKIPELFARVACASLDGDPPAPVVVGGAAFAPGVPPVEPWEEFTQDAYVLPRWGYRRKGGAASLTLTVRRDEIEDPDDIERLVEEARTLMRALAHESATSLIERIDLARAVVRHLPAEDWTNYIAAIHAAIASGEYQKIVAARRCVIELRKQLEDTGFMARVFAAYPDCTHFAIRRPSSTFLGASPETLFRKHGDTLETHALAGTTRIHEDPRVDSSPDVAALQSSRKDLDEHALVVDRISSALERFTTNIEYSPTPSTRRVRNLVHLQTPIHGTLRSGVSAFDLLDALHPTPAVGGTPAREAARWLNENEPLERGWYTGTVGWISANGDAEMAVAIRCGVLTKERAYIFAGAGIVAASNAAAEYAETGSKMGPLLRALGVLY